MIPSGLVYYRNDLGPCCFRVCGRQFLWNPGIYLPNFAVSLPRTRLLCHSPPWESHIIGSFRYESLPLVLRQEDKCVLKRIEIRSTWLNIVVLHVKLRYLGLWTFGFCFQIYLLTVLWQTLSPVLTLQSLRRRLQILSSDSVFRFIY